MLAANVGFESLNREFKEFCLQISTEEIYIDSEILNILRSGKLCEKYKSIVIQSIEYYFKNCFPKYIISFLNAGIEGELCLGINDNGEVTGIPILDFEEINIEDVKGKFYDILERHVDKFEEIKKYVEFDMQQLEINVDLLSNMEIDKLLKRYTNRSNIRRNAYNRYRIERNAWFSNVSMYEKKIIDIINTKETRRELHDYVNENCNSNEVKENICRLLKRENIPYMSTENCKDNSTIRYWACCFKDYKLANLLLNRPKKPNVPLRIHPDLIFSRTTPLRLRFLNANKNLCYYLIKIRVKKSEKMNNYLYMHAESRKTYYKIRRLNSQMQPYCSNF